MLRFLALVAAAMITVGVAPAHGATPPLITTPGGWRNVASRNAP